MKLIIQLFLIIFSFLFYSFAHAKAENAFYILHTTNMNELNSYLATIEKHHHSIHLLIAQAYQIDHEGKVTGYLNQELIDLSKKYSVNIMAMVTNKDYDSNKAHQFLSSNIAQENALNNLLTECKKYNLYGLQFDFEKISIGDKNSLTAFYKKSADLMHQNGFHISYAVIPAFPNDLTQSSFLKKFYKNWAGAYDLKKLGQYGDFVTIMAYNQHPDGTIPGPNASITYVEAAIQNALKSIPAEKISLGIPAYSLHWYSGHQTIPTRQLEISYKDAMKLIKQHNASITWSHAEQVNYSRYEHHWLNEYVYLEDADSFSAKQALSKKFKLRGISVFRIGTEDQDIWKAINKSIIPPKKYS